MYRRHPLNYAPAPVITEQKSDETSGVGAKDEKDSSSKSLQLDSSSDLSSHSTDEDEGHPLGDINVSLTENKTVHRKKKTSKQRKR